MELRHYRPQVEQIRRLLNGIFDAKKRATAIKVVKTGDIDNMPDSLEIYRGRINQSIMLLSHIPIALHSEVLADLQNRKSPYNHGITIPDDEEENDEDLENEAQKIVDNMKF